jgi:hypothetical protein
MSRDYRGSAYRVLVILKRDPKTRRALLWEMTEPAAYEDCERACLIWAWGATFEGQPVLGALLVPVAGVDVPEPGLDFGVTT